MLPACPRPPSSCAPAHSGMPANARMCIKTASSARHICPLPAAHASNRSAAACRMVRSCFWPDPALLGRGWGADGPGRGRGRVALSATVARRSHDGSRFRRRSRDAGLGPPAGRPRPSGDPDEELRPTRRRPSPGLVGLPPARPCPRPDHSRPCFSWPD
eukprot:355900-Chlamydomonas_euryale.AAC.1